MFLGRAPSDHNGVLGVPISHASVNSKPQPRKVLVRPLPDSLISKFGSTLVKEDWACLDSGMSATELVETFVSYTSQLIDCAFPEKLVTVSDRDKPYMTEKL